MRFVLEEGTFENIIDVIIDREDDEMIVRRFKDGKLIDKDIFKCEFFDNYQEYIDFCDKYIEDILVSNIPDFILEEDL